MAQGTHETGTAGTVVIGDENIASVRGFQLDVVSGPDQGKQWQSNGDRGVIGAHPSCDLVLSDKTVSRFHCEILVSEGGAQVRDLGSSNHTLVDGVRICDAYLKRGSLLRLGRSEVRFQYLSRENAISLSQRTSFGGLIGRSVLMRSMFAMLERVAATAITALLQGETGTGKSEAARAIHRESARKDGPFVMLDCGAIPANLLESDLFGHEKGAFTGAAGTRKGAFEDADGGTIFLDEIGEMPLDLQSRLLSVLEDRAIRRLGSSALRPVDVRVITATNRDLRAEVNHGRFREDLYYRIAVVTIHVPPLRRRLDDLPEVAARLLSRMGVPDDRIVELMTAELITALTQAAWPGNIRELRNYLERYLVFQELGPLEPAEPGDDAAADEARSGIAVDAALPFSEARQRVLDAFERVYVSSVVSAHDGNVSRAATAAGVDRTYLYKLIRRHQLKID